jgi:hypothetical protein
MRVFLGIILGVLLTVAVAYLNDHVASGSSGSTVETATTDANGHPMTTTTDTTTRRLWVNWDVVDSDWRGLTIRARHAWNWMSSGFKRT